MPNLSKGLKQAYDLQDLAFELAMKSKLGMTDEELDQARTVHSSSELGQKHKSESGFTGASHYLAH